jgi:GntR family transcriptional regulator
MREGRATAAATLSSAETLMAGGAPGVPLYRAVKRLLTGALAAGEWRPGTALPAERLMAQRFHVAVGTLRKAVDELVQESLLVRHQGRGTFVAIHGHDRFRFKFFHIASRDGQREFPDVELLAFRKGRADALDAAALQIAPGAVVFRVRNQLSLRGAPASVDDVTIAQARFPGLTERVFRDRPGTIYQLYQATFGVTVVSAAERLRAVRAEGEIARRLGVEVGAPLLQVRRIALTYVDGPVELRVSAVNTMDNEYVTDVGSMEGR